MQRSNFSLEDDDDFNDDIIPELDTTVQYVDLERTEEDEEDDRNTIPSNTSGFDSTGLLTGYLDSEPSFLASLPQHSPVQRQSVRARRGRISADDSDMEVDDDDEEGQVTTELYNSHIRQQQRQEQQPEEDIEGERTVDDSEKENNAVRIYHETHPDIEQKNQGGREIADHEAVWTVSTFRPDWGVEKMRDNNPLTYWQSDCPNPKSPHTVDLYFHQATFIKQVSIFIDFFQDESYSPQQISIRGGTTYRDLHEIVELDCGETVGWMNADLSSIMDEPVRVFQLQIAILSTHLNGRDTHIRQIKVYSVPLPFLQETTEADGELKIQPTKERGLR